MLLLLSLLLAPVAIGVELSSSPAELRSLNVSGYLPWLNVEDAACDSPRAAAAECYAGVDTQELFATGFDFDVPYVDWVEARWEVSAVPVPFDGWRVARAALRCNGSEEDAGFANATRESSLSLRVRVAGNVDWRNVSLHLALASTNENTYFLASCVELRAASSWTEPPPPPPPPPRVVRYEIAVGVATLLALALVCAHRIRARRGGSLTSRDIAIGELTDMTPSAYIDGVSRVADAEVDDPFVKSAFYCRISERDGVACALADSTDHQRFRRLRAIRHPNLVEFLGLYDTGDVMGFCTVWARYRAPLIDRLRDFEPCAELGLGIAQAAACALAELQKHHFVHGSVSCRALVVEDDERIALIWAGHARRHDVGRYQETDEPALRWLAPETLDDGSLDLASDRWAFGVLCWEAFSGVGSVPFPRLGAREFRDKIRGLEWEAPEHAHESTWGIARRCLELDPGERPKMSAVREALLAQSEFLGEAPSDERGLLRGLRAIR